MQSDSSWILEWDEGMGIDCADEREYTGKHGEIKSWEELKYWKWI